jgi:hypothetical protein
MRLSYDASLPVKDGDITNHSQCDYDKDTKEQAEFIF